jgi:hypothetical protein
MRHSITISPFLTRRIVTVKKFESPNFVAQNEAQRDTEETEACKVKAPTLTLEVVKRALVFILSEFEANREPTSEQVSKAVGMDSMQLGKALSRLDIKSKSIHREGESVNIYPLASKARVWELAALDTEGLQKIVEAMARAMENDREHSTVFDYKSTGEGIRSRPRSSLTKWRWVRDVAEKAKK